MALYKNYCKFWKIKENEFLLNLKFVHAKIVSEDVLENKKYGQEIKYIWKY